jgi:hypothetical protein
MAKVKTVEGTEVLGVIAPKLSELKSRPCSLEELQAVMVQLIEIVNANAATNNRAFIEMEDRKADKEWRATM